MQEHKFTAIIPDTDLLKEIIEKNYPYSAILIKNEEAFYPVSGIPRRPEVIYYSTLDDIPNL